MKILLCLVLTTLVLAQAINVKRKSDRELDGYLGPAKTVLEEWSPLEKPRYYIQPGTRCRQHAAVYDEKGRELQSSLFPGSCGMDELRTTYIYDNEGNFTTKEEEFRDPKSPPPPPPMMAPPGTKSAPSGPPKSILKYDDKGRKIEKSVVRTNGEIIYRIVYVWDEQDREEEFHAYDTKGVRYSRSVYHYDGKQRIPTSSESYGRGDQLTSKTTYSDYKFNRRGDWIERKSVTESLQGKITKEISLTIRTITYF